MKESQTVVTCQATPPETEQALPTIEIFAPMQDEFISQSIFIVSDIARSELGIKTVTIN